MEYRKKRGRAGGTRCLALLGAITVTISLGALPLSGRAAELLPPASRAGGPAVLASVTVLSEAAMARESAAGVQPAQILGNQAAQPRVMLWDEMRTPPELPLGTNGTVSLTTPASSK
jgi:hypothetical protein